MLMVVERWRLLGLLDRLPAFLGHMYLLGVTAIGWALFRSETLADATTYLGAMAGMGASATPIAIDQLMTLPVLIATVVGIICALPIGPLLARTAMHVRLLPFVYIGYIVLLTLSMLHIGIGTYNPFIYFRF